MENLNQAMNALSDQDPNEFRNSVYSALSDKIQNALDAKKIEIAQSMFTDQEYDYEPTETEISDEDI